MKESKFTRPRDDCPNPELWSSPNGQATEVEITQLIKAVIIALKPRHCLEVGTHEAHTSRAIGLALKANGRGRLTTIEIDKLKSDNAKRKLIGLPVDVINTDGLYYVPEKIDFIFVDGLPTPQRIKEWNHYKPYLNEHAIVMFHDTGPHRIFRAELDKDPDLTVVHIPTPRGVSIGQCN